MSFSPQKEPETAAVAVNLTPYGYYQSVIRPVSSRMNPDKTRQHGWTTINDPSNINSSLNTPPPASPHDVAEPQSQQASKFRSHILASTERLKWPPGYRKRKKSPSQSPKRPRKKTRVSTTKSEISGRVVKFPDLGKTFSKPDSMPLAHSEHKMVSPDQILLPRSSSAQNAISKKRSLTTTAPHEVSKSPSVTANGTDMRQTNEHFDHHTTTLKEMDENSNDLFMYSSDDLEEFLEAEQLLTGTTAQTLTVTPRSDNPSSPLKSNLDLQSEGQANGLPMTPFMRTNFQPQPPATRMAKASTITGLSTLRRTLTCFRIAEAIRLLKCADPSQTLTFELFGVSRPPMHDKTSETTNPAIEVADLFFPHLPPSLRLDVDPTQVQRLYKGPPTSTSRPTDNALPYKSRESSTNMVRTNIRAWPKTLNADTALPEYIGTTLRDKFEIRVICAQATTWEEVRETRSVVEATQAMTPT
ncbi:hypothetical protein LTR84_008301 [Exophiala bonariae]|uniref:Uncharacterized protein n=1 Tax=Exophiala bonariae TaxID=1690606 RepID=A0AAV9N1G7_9EURO|nr:hypothetical protein LTR84_008301 [Exophiala bonariae]